MPFNPGARLERLANERVINSRYLVPQRHLKLPLPFVKNQLASGVEVNCCVSAAFTVCMEFLESYNQTIELSLLFHYHYATDGRYQEALSFNQGKITAEDYGICEQHLYPYQIAPDNVEIRPKREARSDGEERLLERCKKLIRPNEIDDWLMWLCKGCPLILLFYLDRSTYLSLPNTGATLEPPIEPSSYEGHAVVVCGFNMDLQLFIIQDCRGEDWCDSGFWYLPFEIAKRPDFAHTVGVILETSKGELRQ